MLLHLGEVDLTTLIQLITQKVTNPQSERPEDLRDMFKLYDKEGKGVLSVKEMKHLLTSVGEKLTEDEADELIKMTGCSQNGQVNYDSEFVKKLLLLIGMLINNITCYFIFRIYSSDT